MDRKTMAVDLKHKGCNCAQAVIAAFADTAGVSMDEAMAFEIEYRNTHAMGFLNTCCPNYTGNSYSFYCGNSYEISGNVIENISKGGFYEPEVQPYIEDAIRPLKENEVLIIKEDEFDPVMESYLVGYEQITKERAMALLDRSEIEEGFYYIKKPNFKYQKLTKSELLSSPAYIEDRRND